MRDEQRKLRFKKNETKMKTITFETRSANIVPNIRTLSIEVDLSDMELFNLLDEIGEREVVNYLEEKGYTINN